MHPARFDLLELVGGKAAVRIYIEVVLGVKQADEPEEHARFRASVTRSGITSLAASLLKWLI